MKVVRYMCAVLALMFCGMTVRVFAQTAAAAQPAGVLKPDDLGKIVPGAVFFRGQSATTQLRNSGGVRFSDGYLMFVVMVDNSGYSTGIQEKYQAYLVTEVPLDFRGQKLPPGAYGMGMVRNAGPGEVECFIQDLGAHDLLQFAASTDVRLHRPVPLQVVAEEGAGKYRLYMGRNYVEFARAQ